VLVSGSGVAALNLGYRWSGRRDISGNMFRFESHVRMDNGEHRDIRPVYDIFFVSAP
jgi:hypothetical protein